MSCGTIFNRCSDASDLSSAEFVVPLTAGIEDGVTHVYIGRSTAADGTVDGDVARVSNEEMAAYNNSNLFNPYELTNEGVVDFMNHSIAEAVAVIAVEEQGEKIENFDLIQDVFANPDDVALIGTAMIMDDNLSGQNLIDALESALAAAELTAQQANNGELPEEKYIGSYSTEEMQFIATNWAEAANETVDRMNLAKDLPDYRTDLIEKINAYPAFDATTVNALEAEINHGLEDGGEQHYDNRIDLVSP